MKTEIDLLLRGDRITLTGPCLSSEVCEKISAHYGQTAPLSDVDLTAEAKRVISGYQAKIGKPLNEPEQRIAYLLAGFLALKPGGEARAYVDVLVDDQIWFPDRKTGLVAEKRAAERRVKILAMVALHHSESQRRDAAGALDRRIQADRASRTPEQRAAFVSATLARFRQGGAAA